MKKTLLILILLIYSFSNAQIVNIPDANFKNALLSHNPTIDVNNDGNIQVTEAENASIVSVNYKNISDLTGINSFINIQTLNCTGNSLNSLDVSSNTSLVILRCNNNNITNLDLSTNTVLFSLTCYNNNLTSLNINGITTLVDILCYDNNNLTSLDLSTNTALETIDCSGTSLTSLDFSNNVFLYSLYSENTNIISLDLSASRDLVELYCGNNSNLNYINFKDGNNSNHDVSSFSFENLPNLQTVCIDELNSLLATFIRTEVGHAITYTEYCSFIPVQSNQIIGNIKLDLDNNGCNVTDLGISNLMIEANNGVESFITFTQDNGGYRLYTNEGNFTITTTLPSYYSVTPNGQTTVFTGFDNVFNADFCIASTQVVNDLTISLIPTSQVRPGFDVSYRLVYRNIGTTQLSGTVTLDFNETKLNFLNASEIISSQTSNTLEFNYTNLDPLETRTIDLEFNIFAPPIVNIDDILNFTVIITPISGDINAETNIYSFDQTVIGSYDPNDITCLEGNEIPLEDTDKYLHYIIRFQNEGTADAINIVVKNVLDTKLDWTTFQLETSSHQNRVAIKNGNEVEFIFENINLPDETTDEPNSHGFIAYKIKPKSNVVLEDIFSSTADIFFDYNEAVITNTATTEIVNTLAVKEKSILKFNIYPTPTNGILKVKSKMTIVKIEIYNKLGQLVLEANNKSNINIASLSNGLYICKVEDVDGNLGVQKVIKK